MSTPASAKLNRLASVAPRCVFLSMTGRKRPVHAAAASAVDRDASSGNTGKRLVPDDGQAGLTELGDGASLLFVPRAFSVDDAAALFSELKELRWQQVPVMMMGKKVMQPRLITYMADDSSMKYKYSGATLTPEPWNPYVMRAKEEVERLASGSKFNSCLLNLYRNGSDYVGWHSDDEPVYQKESSIASVSLGACRDFVLRKKDDPRRKIRFKLDSGDLLIMQGTTQSYWAHCLPKRTRVTTPRINLTFRTVVQ